MDRKLKAKTLAKKHNLSYSERLALQSAIRPERKGILTNPNFTTSEMAKRLGLSEGTVKSYRHVLIKVGLCEPRVKIRTGKYEKRILKDYEVMTAEQVAEKHDIPKSYVYYLSSKTGFKKRERKEKKRIGERFKKELEEIRKRKEISCYDLAEILPVCTTTVWTDLKRLEKNGMIKKVRESVGRTKPKYILTKKGLKETSVGYGQLSSILDTPCFSCLFWYREKRSCWHCHPETCEELTEYLLALADD